MKKLILTSAAVLFIAFTVSADNGAKCDKKSEKNCSTKECSKEATKKDACHSKDTKCKDHSSCDKTSKEKATTTPKSGM